MTIDEAKELRPVEEKKRFLLAGEPDRFSGKLHFDAEGRLKKWEVEIESNAGPKEVKDLLEERFGEPARKYKELVFMRRYDTIIEWHSEECDSLIRLHALPVSWGVSLSIELLRLSSQGPIKSAID